MCSLKSLKSSFWSIEVGQHVLSTSSRQVSFTGIRLGSYSHRYRYHFHFAILGTGRALRRRCLDDCPIRGRCRAQSRCRYGRHSSSQLVDSGKRCTLRHRRGRDSASGGQRGACDYDQVLVSSLDGLEVTCSSGQNRHLARNSGSGSDSVPSIECTIPFVLT